jgi:hypothetical protein
MICDCFSRIKDKYYTEGGDEMRVIVVVVVCDAPPPTTTNRIGESLFFVEKEARGKRELTLEAALISASV